MRRRLLIILFVGFWSISKSQTFGDLEGCWEPKSEFTLESRKDFLSIPFGFPLLSLGIGEAYTNTFLTPSKGSINENCKRILIETYRSEPRLTLIEQITLQGKIKYKLPYFSSNLNLKYLPRELVTWYSTKDIYISKEGDSLMIEIYKEGSIVSKFVLQKKDESCFSN